MQSEVISYLGHGWGHVCADDVRYEPCLNYTQEEWLDDGRQSF